MGQSKKEEVNKGGLFWQETTGYGSKMPVCADDYNTHSEDIKAECPNCGFIRQHHIPGEHRPIPDILKDTKKPLHILTTQKQLKRQANSSSNMHDKQYVNTATECLKECCTGYQNKVKPTKLDKDYELKSGNSHCTKCDQRCQNESEILPQQLSLTLQDTNMKSETSFIPCKKCSQAIIGNKFHEARQSNMAFAAVVSENNVKVYSHLPSLTNSSMLYSCGNYSECESIAFVKNCSELQEYSRIELIDEYTRIGRWNPDEDFYFRQQALKWMMQSEFYFKDLTMAESRKKLKKSSRGTFLLRDSSNKDYFASLSIKTERGTTSIRVCYEKGRFRLDCEENSFLKLPSFESLVLLIQYYVTFSKQADNNCVFLESSGRKDTTVYLGKPYIEQPQSLKHLCRKKLNLVLSENQKDRVMTFYMTSGMVQYMKQYPYFL